MFIAITPGDIADCAAVGVGKEPLPRPRQLGNLTEKRPGAVSNRGVKDYFAAVLLVTSRQTPSLVLRTNMRPLLMVGVDQHLPSTAFTRLISL